MPESMLFGVDCTDMPFLVAAMVLLWTIVLLYVVFLVNKQKALEALLEELEEQLKNQPERERVGPGTARGRGLG